MNSASKFLKMIIKKVIVRLKQVCMMLKKHILMITII